MVRLKQIATRINCPASWDAMTGSDAVRRCATCRKDVYNLSEMSEAQAHALLEASEERCVRFYYRPDGTIVTSRCPDGARTAPRAAAVGVAASLAAFSTLTVALPDQPAPLAGSSADTRVAMGSIRLVVKKPTKAPPPAPAARVLVPAPEEPVADIWGSSLAPAPPIAAVPKPLPAAPSSNRTLFAVLAGLLAVLVATATFGAIKLGKPR